MQMYRLCEDDLLPKPVRPRRVKREDDGFNQTKRTQYQNKFKSIFISINKYEKNKIPGMQTNF